MQVLLVWACVVGHVMGLVLFTRSDIFGACNSAAIQFR